MQNTYDLNTSSSQAISKLAEAIQKFAQYDGDFKTSVSSLSLHRRKSPTQPLPCIFSLGLGVVAQGRKQALLGSSVFQYELGQSILTTMELPVSSHVMTASLQKPLLGLMLTFDSQEISQAAIEMQLTVPSRSTTSRSIAVERLDDLIVWDLVRLVNLLDQPNLVGLLAPLIKREIIFRLLIGPHALQLLCLIAEGSPSQQILKAITWLKNNFSRAMSVNDLAKHVHMSPSTFRQHFRNITGTSPLQYQKQLRLQESRYLMLSQEVDAGSAGERVGYESASQFSREYNRLFGLPPLQDIKRARLAT